MVREPTESEDERAVSPAVGVVLLLAVAVVIAVTIGAYVTGYGGTLRGKADQVDVRFDEKGMDDVDVQLTDTGPVENASNVSVTSERCRVGGTVGGTERFSNVGDVVSVTSCPNGATITVRVAIEGEQYVVSEQDGT
ncbi:archaellin/type IV pilin N-terminal domain-containing protein [Halomicrococcus sp. SG-WS-1]|uniref:archaellin/type IV pilin N-terminal domain-containing protein n=1 Tax=Halomicrococcus sp. SG-WS-1 TaxID=3439057 RepID=UPI003F7A9D7C